MSDTDAPADHDDPQQQAALPLALPLTRDLTGHPKSLQSSKLTTDSLRKIRTLPDSHG